MDKKALSLEERAEQVVANVPSHVQHGVVYVDRMNPFPKKRTRVPTDHLNVTSSDTENMVLPRFYHGFVSTQGQDQLPG